MAVTGDHAPFSSPPRARFYPAYDPRSACGAAARASRHANAGIRHTPPFFGKQLGIFLLQALDGGELFHAQLVKGVLRRLVQENVALMLCKVFLE